MFKKTIINVALKVLDKFVVSKLTYEPARAYIQTLYDDIKQVVDLLTDKNPNDKEQLAEFWEENRAELVGDTLGAAVKIIAKEVKDPDVAAALIEMLNAIDLEQNEPV